MALTKVTGDFIKDGVLTQAHLHTSHGITTAHIGEGSNLYFTNARVDSRIGDLSTSNLSEGSNLYYTNARADARIALQVGSNLDLSSKSTSDLSEGTNLYFTNARADARIAAASTSDLSEGTNLYYTDARVGSYLTTNSYATQSYVNTQVSNLVDSAPSTLDTLNELAAALGDDANFSTTVTNSIATKLPLAGGNMTGAINFDKTNSSGGGDFDFIVMGYNGSWSNNQNGLASIAVNDGTGVVGRYGITYGSGGGRFVITDLYDGGYGASGDILTIAGNGATNLNGSFAATGNVTGANLNISNWDTAYGWGNHASAGYLTSYTETDTLATVTARGASTSTESIFTGNLRARKSQTAGNYTTAALWTESFNSTATGIAFHISGNVGKFLEMRTNGILYWNGDTVWHSGNDGPGSGLNADLLDGIDSASFVRSDADDTLSGQYTFTKTNDHAIKVGTIRGTAVGSQTGEFIQMYNRVNIGGPNGWGASNTATPTYGLSTYGGTRLSVYNDYTESGGSMRAPIFYDSNNTGYYLDPASTSHLNTLSIDTNARIFNNQNRNHSTYQNFNDTGLRAGINYLQQGTNGPTGTASHQWYGWRLGLGGDYGTQTGSSGHYAQEWYIARKGQGGNSTGGNFLWTRDMEGGSWGSWHKVDTDRLQLAAGYAVTMGSWGLRNVTPNGYIEMGPANTSHAHIYTDRSNFYFNAQIQLLGGSLINQNDIRAQLFYDLNDTAYYVNPTGSSRMQQIDISSAGATGLNITSTDIRSSASSTWTGDPGGAGKIQYHSNRWYIVSDSSSNRIVQFRRNGSDKCYIDNDGRIIDVYDVRAYLYYDRDNTGYYVDPAANSVMNTINGFGFSQSGGNGKILVTNSSNGYLYVNNWIYVDGAGIFSSTNGAHFYPNTCSDYGAWRMNGNKNGWNGITFDVSGCNVTLMASTSTMGFYNDTDNEWMIESQRNGNTWLYYNGTWELRTANGYGEARSQMRAPIYYDTNNTGYYLHMDAGSNIHDISMHSATATHFGIANTSNGTRDGIALYGGATGGEPTYGLLFTGTSLGSHGGVTSDWATYFTMNDNTSRGWIFRRAGAGNSASITAGGLATFDNSVRSPIFYDSGNTNYYCDPASTSKLSTVEVGASGYSNIWLGGQSGNYFRFHTNNSHTYFDGNVGDINWRQGSSTRFIFYMTTANMTVNGTVTQYSDSRLKENIMTIDGALDKVNQLRGVYYNRTDINTSERQIGLIAQEVESVVPEVVHTADDELNTKSISYAQLNALLVEAIKELKADNDSLRARIETLENQ